jgi:PAS domain S-box-containing protein
VLLDARRVRALWRPTSAIAVVAVLLCLGLANVVLRVNWEEYEDGVLWTPTGQGLTATELTPAASQLGLRRGDVLLAIDGRPVEVLDDLVAALHGGSDGSELTYSILRLGSQQILQVTLHPVPQGNRTLYVVLAAVAIFTLFVGLSVRLRRPADQATLHFFWLSVAFFGVFTFSFSGRWDPLDKFFYWADAVAIVLLPPLFMHFALVFPERPQAWVRTAAGRAMLPLVYLPALLLGGARVAVFSHARARGAMFSDVLQLVERAEMLYLAACLLGGLAVFARALTRVRSIMARRQLRWIVWGTTLGALPFAGGYLIPLALGFDPWPRMMLTAIPLVLVPLAFASAIVRYRLMDVEVIIKRGLGWAAALSAIVAIYAILLRVAGAVFLGGSERHNSIIALLATMVVVLLARPVKTAIERVLDRAYYRDRYDYRRALVAFARDLNSDLDLNRLSERLVARVVETLVVDRMVLLLDSAAEGAEAAFTPIRSAGFDVEAPPPALERSSGLGTRLAAGHAVALDDQISSRRFAAGELDFWRQHGLHYFVPCVSKEGTIAVMALGRKESGEPLNSEDVALLAAVAGQVATALENGRLYRQLRLKADELDRLREFSENIVESLNDGLVVVDPSDRIVRWNQALETIYGVGSRDAIGRRLDAVFDPEFLDALAAAGRENPEHPSVARVSLASRHARGPERLLVNVAAAPLRTPEGAVAGRVIIIENITSRVQLEEQLQISEKMASLGLLAAGVAHEVNTPLTGISSFTQMLLERAEPDDPRTKLLEKIERQTFRAAKIVNSLLNLARPAHGDAGPVDVHAVINDVLSLVEHQYKAARIKVRKELAPISPIVRGVEYKLQQVFLNLFLNARDAMPKGGWLSVSSSHDGDELRIEVADTGSGIPSEHLSRIYDPFFTTKDIGQGTGLGLSITYGIVQEHGGVITCSSKLGQGTCFTITLPLAASRVAAGELAGS